MNTDKLQDLAYAAEEDGREVEIYWASSGVINYINIEGEEFINEWVDDELYDLDGEAEGMWRE